MGKNTTNWKIVHQINNPYTLFNDMDKYKPKPFLRWAGGKSWLLKSFSGIIPKIINVYHEPFLGGGSFFFYVLPKNLSHLSDSNEELIIAYQQVKDNVDELLSILEGFKNTSKDYYKIRDIEYTEDLYRAAQFIYLNRTGFNGIYRVNLNGKYNVPYGHKSYKILFDEKIFRQASKALTNTNIFPGDFSDNAVSVSSGDLVFLDPPYTVSDTNNGFIKYNEKLFKWADQVRLFEYIEYIVEKGAKYILTNAKHPKVYRLFGSINEPLVVNRYSVIGGKNSKRRQVEEYVFSNLIKDPKEFI